MLADDIRPDLPLTASAAAPPATPGRAEARPSMAALVKDGAAVALREVARPAPEADDVVLRVELAGLCRTDLYVADGLLPSRDPVVLGHELCGEVVAAGPAAGLALGTRVTVMPLCPCRACPACAAGAPCLRPIMLGVGRDGAFAEEVVVPAACAVPLPAGLPAALGAYCEPVAAAMAVLKAGLDPAGRGVIYGQNRIAQLTARVLAAHGFSAVRIWSPEAGEDAAPAPGSCDFAIETVASAASLSALLVALRPGGTLVLKSRPHTPVPLDVALAVRKEIVLRAVNYAPFPEALALLAGGRLQVADLLGAVHPLAAFAEVFAAARSGEAAKLFFAPAG